MLLKSAKANKLSPGGRSTPAASEPPGATAGALFALDLKHKALAKRLDSPTAWRTCPTGPPRAPRWHDAGLLLGSAVHRNPADPLASLGPKPRRSTQRGARAGRSLGSHGLGVAAGAALGQSKPHIEPRRPGPYNSKEPRLTRSLFRVLESIARGRRRNGRQILQVLGPSSPLMALGSHTHSFGGSLEFLAPTTHSSPQQPLLAP